MNPASHVMDDVVVTPGIVDIWLRIPRIDYFETDFHHTCRCWEKCVRDPSGSLTPAEQKCVMNCGNRYLEAHSVVMQKIGDMIKPK